MYYLNLERVNFKTTCSADTSCLWMVNGSCEWSWKSRYQILRTCEYLSGLYASYFFAFVTSATLFSWVTFHCYYSFVYTVPAGSQATDSWSRGVWSAENPPCVRGGQTEERIVGGRAALGIDEPQVLIVHLVEQATRQVDLHSVGVARQFDTVGCKGKTTSHYPSTGMHCAHSFSSWTKVTYACFMMIRFELRGKALRLVCSSWYLWVGYDPAKRGHIVAATLLRAARTHVKRFSCFSCPTRMLHACVQNESHLRNMVMSAMLLLRRDVQIMWLWFAWPD